MARRMRTETTVVWRGEWRGEMSYRDEVNKVFSSPHFDTISQRGFVLEISARADAEITQLRADAERYRFLRSCNIDMRNRLEHYADSALDTAIDAARGAFGREASKEVGDGK